MDKFKYYIEKNIFGVCAYIGNRFGINSNIIRMYFIYLSFFTFGSPIIIYFMMAFILENKDYFKPSKYRRRKSVWDL